MALAEGDKAPDFTLPADDGSEVSLSDFKGKRVVLYFYPKDATPGCTQEACDFRDASAQLKKKGAVVLGVSKDSVASHQKFKAKQALNFPLLSDADTTVMQAYGAWGEKTLYGRKMTGCIRTTVLIGKDGRIERIWPKVKVAGHADEVLEALGGNR
ncbi:MAG: thioredoxin-dependent thiol peroxidase [Myxococcales bacterium]